MRVGWYILLPLLNDPRETSGSLRRRSSHISVQRRLIQSLQRASTASQREHLASQRLRDIDDGDEGSCVCFPFGLGGPDRLPRRSPGVLGRILSRSKVLGLTAGLVCYRLSPLSTTTNDDATPAHPIRRSSHPQTRLSDGRQATTAHTGTTSISVATVIDLASPAGSTTPPSSPASILSAAGAQSRPPSPAPEPIHEVAHANPLPPTELADAPSRRSLPASSISGSSSSCPTSLRGCTFSILRSPLPLTGTIQHLTTTDGTRRRTYLLLSSVVVESTPSAARFGFDGICSSTGASAHSSFCSHRVRETERECGGNAVRANLDDVNGDDEDNGEIQIGNLRLCVERSGAAYSPELSVHGFELASVTYSLAWSLVCGL
ncbi:hypothetical protein C8F01DRAFT_1245313 [Mycena amicta]|nr:hypothetical protein C8F01DRAFT_1245313 [Mycena amicta]